MYGIACAQQQSLNNYENEWQWLWQCGTHTQTTFWEPKKKLSAATVAKAALYVRTKTTNEKLCSARFIVCRKFLSVTSQIFSTLFVAAAEGIIKNNNNTNFKSKLSKELLIEKLAHFCYCHAKSRWKREREREKESVCACLCKQKI